MNEKAAGTGVNSKQTKESIGQSPGRRADLEDTFREIHEHKPIGHREPILEGNIQVRHKPSKSNMGRVPTGIPGFDKVIEGGLKKHSVTLAGGCAGAGKSIFAMQYLINGITQFNEPGVYVSFEENREEIFDDMACFGWDLEELEKQGKFVFLRYNPDQVNKVLKTGGGPIRDVIDSIGAKRLVIDSISAFSLLYETELKQREAALSLFYILRRWDCTTMVTGQYFAVELPHDSAAVEFEVDNIIWLYNIKKEDIRVRAIEVFKMRGTKHSVKTFPFEITTEGIVIYPEETIF